ncbi:MAG: hypothetical protein J6U94_02070 [Paludibacteraceae bacterium]|nr:hypothetical protein [Paludibacteraceae bacterium]
MKITNHIQQNIRTLFLIMSVVLISWGNVQKVKGQFPQIKIFSNGIQPAELQILETFFPTNFYSITFSEGVPCFDYIIFPLADGSDIQFLVFKSTFEMGSTPQHYYKMVGEIPITVTLPNTLFTKLNPLDFTNKSIYYIETNSNVQWISNTYFNTTTFSSLNTKEFLTSNILPEDFPFTLFNGNNLQMDQLFIAANFNESEIALAQNVFANNSITANQSYMLPFSKVTCSDGVQFYLSTGAYPTKSTNFTLNNIHNKKLYFTGTVDEAYAGAGKESEGFIHLKGTDTEKAHIYLDNFSIKKVKNKTIEISLNDILSSGLPGMAAPIAVSSAGFNKNNPMEVAFHIRGNNKLVGGAKTNFSMKALSGDESSEETTNSMIFSMLLYLLNMNASPITVRPEPTDEGIDGIKNKTCSLTFDDKWISAGTEIRTNGLLDLPTTRDGREAPAINLGNAYGRCSFDGGQYKLATAVSNNMFYVSSMSIAYRMVDIIGIKIYGLGTTMATPASDNTVPFTLKINNGTFSVYSAEDIKDSIDVVAHGWYKSYDDMRLPIKTIIDGGSFNSYVYACDASAEQGTVALNSNGDPLCRAGYEVSEPNSTTGLSALNLPEYPYYGTQSLTPVQEGSQWWVYPYLPGTDCEDRESEHIYNWVTVIPQMGASMMNVTMGGDVEVLTEDPNSLLPRKNNYFFYTRLNKYTKLNGTVEIAGIPIPIYKAIELGGEYEFTKVTNTEDYKIEHGLYTMLSFNSNTWATICPPFDVHNIYVIETLPDEKLAEHGLTQADKGTEKFLKAQGKCDAVLAQGIVTSLLPDILSKKGSGVGMNLIDICRNTLGIEPYKLTHYNPNLPGHSSKEANYYLYEQKHDADEWEIFSGAWTKANNLEDYADKWVYATPVEGNTYTDQNGNTLTAPILMKRDSVYSIFLPAGKDKYWDGKYLIFEGYGPQEMHGSQTAEDAKWNAFIMEDWGYSNDQFFLAGNSSFTNLHIETADDLVFFPDTDGKKHDYVRANVGDSILPWQAYMAMNQYNTETYATLSALSPSRNAVQAAPQADELTNIPLVKDRSLIAYEQEGLVLCAYTKQQIAVYGVDGILVWKSEMKEGEQQHLSIPAGVYIIQGEQETTKIVVRE